MTSTLVLDTNVLLDWWVFGDPRLDPLKAAAQAGSVRLLTCEAGIVEFTHMLGHPSLARWQPDRDAVLAGLAALCETMPVPAPSGPRLRCRDPDDQVFIDLALAQRCRWLLSRDKAVLALARRARPLGLEITVPERWAAP